MSPIFPIKNALNANLREKKRNQKYDIKKNENKPNNSHPQYAVSKSYDKIKKFMQITNIQNIFKNLLKNRSKYI